MANGKFVAYYRCSTTKQQVSGLGLEAQRENVMRYLNGGQWVLVGEFTDIESGTRKGNNRPELAKAIALCKREKATLVIAKLDRLARNVHFVSGLMESGIEFTAVDMPEANRLTIHIMAAMAEHEAEMISRRTKEALAAAKTRGVQLGTPENLTEEAARKGAKATQSKAIKDYANVAYLIKNLRERGMTLRAIATHLNDLGETTRQGAPFTAMTIQRILGRV